MRPTDENQHGSTRPNLVSGARRAAGGEDNILAKLDREGAHGAAGGSAAGGRRALFALGCLLVLGLLGTLTWLAHQNATTRRVLPGAPVSEVPIVEAPAAVAVAPPAAQAASAPAVPAQAALDSSEQIVPAQQLAPPAAIVNETDVRTAAGADEMGVPPLVLLQPARPAEPKSMPVIAAPRSPLRLAAAARKVPPVTTASSKSEPQQPVDTDVALLSAIIMHASSHAAERAQLEAQACPQGKKCLAKTDAATIKPAD